MIGPLVAIAVSIVSLPLAEGSAPHGPPRPDPAQQLALSVDAVARTGASGLGGLSTAGSDLRPANAAVDVGSEGASGPGALWSVLVLVGWIATRRRA